MVWRKIETRFPRLFCRSILMSRLSASEKDFYGRATFYVCIIWWKLQFNPCENWQNAKITFEVRFERRNLSRLLFLLLLRWRNGQAFRIAQSFSPLWARDGRQVHRPIWIWATSLCYILLNKFVAGAGAGPGPSMAFTTLPKSPSGPGFWD
jgi:hypothetical protein